MYKDFINDIELALNNLDKQNQVGTKFTIITNHNSLKPFEDKINWVFNNFIKDGSKLEYRKGIVDIGSHKVNIISTDKVLGDKSIHIIPSSKN